MCKQSAKGLQFQGWSILMGSCKKDLTPLLTHWSYISLALSHRYVAKASVISSLVLTLYIMLCFWRSINMHLHFIPFLHIEMTQIFVFAFCIKIGTDNDLLPSGNKPLPEVNQCWPSSMSPYGITRPRYVPFIHIGITQVVEIIPHGQQGLAYLMVVNTIAVDDLVMSGARPSAVMILT